MSDYEFTLPPSITKYLEQVDFSNEMEESRWQRFKSDLLKCMPRGFGVVLEPDFEAYIYNKTSTRGITMSSDICQDLAYNGSFNEIREAVDTVVYKLKKVQTKRGDR